MSYEQEAVMSDPMQPVSVRLTPEERELVKSAALESRTNLSDFIRRRAVEAAEIQLTERRIVTIPVEEWEKFEAWADEPPKKIPGLQRLAKARPEWPN
jgi:uncharacterized protein (DUF1778 family)